MSSFWNRRVSGLCPYVPGEQPKDRKFIKLNTNENPYPPSPEVVKAIFSLINDTGESLRLYPDPLCLDFRKAVAEAYGVKPEQVFPGNGSDDVLAFTFGAFFESAEGACSPDPVPPVLFPDITYSFYPVYARLWNVPFRAVPLTEGDAAHLSAGTDTFSVRVEDYLVPSGGVILPNPNAPTGRALPFRAADGGPNRGTGGLGEIVEYQLKNSRVVVLDEAYAAFGAESAVRFINTYPNLLTVHTLSKSASLAGLRVGFAIGCEELIEGLFRIRDSFNSYTVDRVALAAAAAAVADRAYYDSINKKVIATRDRTAASLTAMGFEVIPSAANFLFIRRKGAESEGAAAGASLSGTRLFEALREKGILVRRFNSPRIADYLRVSIGTDADMDAFLGALEKILGKNRADY
ncbi:MAG: aminotransferase class I/II-fold pyridoxal phosphate-dependent enzyme [Treponema sp.]|jgi:histidinol-phosphate aminotransferase|nr:aminotransferase class I/II-fold pyridoxal phosphate-dependent enzyme [Treponema sp.]